MTPRWKWLVGLTAIFVAPILFIVLMHFKAKHDLATYKKQLVAQGEKLTIAELIPPSVEAENNGAKDLRESISGLSAISQVGVPSMTLIAFGKARATWNEEKIYDAYDRQFTNFWPALRQDMSQAEGDLHQLHQAIGKSKISFHPQYEMGFTLLLPHLEQVKKAAQWSAASTLFYLHENRTNEAAASLKDAIQLPAVYAEEPLMISQLVRIATVQIAFSVTWEALQFRDWNDAMLKEFQESWIQMDFKKNVETSFAMERAMGIRTFEIARKSPDGPTAVLWGTTASTWKADFDEFTVEIFNNPKEAMRILIRRPNEQIWQWWWSYEEEIFLNKYWQESIDARRAIESQKSYFPAMDRVKAADAAEVPATFLLSGSLKGASKRFFLKFAIAEAERELAVAACALERYRVRFASYPESLEKLVPEFVTQMPRDVIDGKPLRYRRNADGAFLLYSVGENGKDDGGDPQHEKTDSRSSIQLVKGRDWVWPQRATPEEIEKWIEESKKRR